MTGTLAAVGAGLAVIGAGLGIGRIGDRLWMQLHGSRKHFEDTDCYDHFSRPY